MTVSAYHTVVGHMMDHMKMDHTVVGHMMDHMKMDHTVMGHTMMDHTVVDHMMSHMMLDLIRMMGKVVKDKIPWQEK